MSASSAEQHTVSSKGDDEDMDSESNGDDEGMDSESCPEDDECEEEALVEYFKVQLRPDASSNSDEQIAKATARMLMVKKKNAACMQNPMIAISTGGVQEVCKPPSNRELANQLIAAVLRNNSSLEGLHAGDAIALQNTLGDARFTVTEAETLLSEAASGLGALLCSSYDRKSLFDYLSGTRLAPLNPPLPDAIANMLRTQLQHLSAEQQAANVDEICLLYNITLQFAVGSAKDWDQETRSGGLWANSPVLAGHTQPIRLESLPRPCIQTGHTQPVLQDQDETYMRAAYMSHAIMRAVFLHTIFLRGPYLPRSLARATSRLDDYEMKEMMIQATSNLENIFENAAKLAREKNQVFSFRNEELFISVGELGGQNA